MLPVAVDGVIYSEYQVVIGDQINACPGRKLPGVYHGVCGAWKYIVHITSIGKHIEIECVMNFIKLLRAQKRESIRGGFN